MLAHDKNNIMKKKSLLDRGLNLIGLSRVPNTEEDIQEEYNFAGSLDNPIKVSVPPASRVSIPDTGYPTSFGGSLKSYLKPEVYLDFIPRIRHLVKINEDVGSVYNDLIQLTNTGHRIKFDQSIDSALADKMKKHLDSKKELWGSGVHGIDGLVNKWIAQILVSGAISNEWVPQRDLKGLSNNILINPENIRFRYNYSTTKYDSYQLVKTIITSTSDNMIKLNPNTFFYSGVLNDTDSPYGVPPFLTALDALSNQKDMKKNIKHILKQLGLLGYLEVKLEKPQRNPQESEKAYASRLDKFLLDSKKNVSNGFSEGIVVGYDGDHEFEFHSTTKQLNGVNDIYNGNEVSVANGLKVSPSFIGQKSTGSESGMSIVFTKMLSQLKNIQQILAANLKFGYVLELQLMGFNIKSTDITIEFNASTITDDLKTWQAKEIKQRVTKALLIDGVMSIDTYSEENGYTKPFGKPLIPFKDQGGAGKKDPQQKANRNEVKKKSARKSRDKNKTQPKRKDGNTNPR